MEDLQKNHMFSPPRFNGRVVRICQKELINQKLAIGPVNMVFVREWHQKPDA